MTARDAFRRAASRPRLFVLAAFALAAVVPALAAQGDEPGKPAAATASQPKAARKKAQGPRVAAKAARKAEAAAKVELPARPAKVVKPPSLTSADVDAKLDAFLATTRAEVAPLTSDAEFVRRVYLDVTGKLPTPDQARAFVRTREKDKRAKLIEYLLNTPEYAENWARYWRDVIHYHATNQNFGRVGYADLEDWLAQQFAANRPWDEIARAMITATGQTDENGAVVFEVAHESAPVELAGEVARVFLGVQIQCAQCHDHPNDRWKRQQFHEFASFFAGTKTAVAKKPQDNGGKPVLEVSYKGPARYAMPDLKEPTRSIPVSPKFFLGESAPTLPGTLAAKDRREMAASYVTGQDNPWFARAFVNRLWYVLTGDAFYTPVDDIGPERKAKAPEVLNALADAWQQGGYDVRWLFRTILNTRAYQREVRSTLSASGRTPFASNCPSRLRADQILDSLAEVLKLPVDGPNGQGGPARKNALTKDLKEAVGKSKVAPRAANGPRALFDFIYGVDPSTLNDDVLGTIPQALYLMNSPLVNQAIEARPNTMLGEILRSTPDNRVALNLLYVRVLSRDPTPKEVQTCGRYIETVKNRKEAFEDILWSLINSTEFITRR
ncbi:MAG: DUF1549 domain-containing protein [Isosphaeraceae bacterium]